MALLRPPARPRGEGSPKEQPRKEVSARAEPLLGVGALARVWFSPAIAAVRAPSQHLCIDRCCTRLGFGPCQCFHAAADSLQSPQ